ncbi:MAG: hypothetical protein A2Z96_03240 [Spirochaetes bacterium GWB1_48_6]|nr:MAG: hypothetical protein A2Z96_03240 [Spirochaetes bacterium GWB1_48_6]
MPPVENLGKILYAEDDYANRKLIELQLRRRGFLCVTVEDGVQALESYAKDTFSLVILDYNMPGLSGTQTLVKIREINPKQKILALTSDDSVSTDLLEQGFDRVVIKPILDDSLLEAVLDVLNS